MNMSESAATVKAFFLSILHTKDDSEYTTSDRSEGQGSAGTQPERRLRGQDQTGVRWITRAPLQI